MDVGAAGWKIAKGCTAGWERAEQLVALLVREKTGRRLDGGAAGWERVGQLDVNGGAAGWEKAVRLNGGAAGWECWSAELWRCWLGESGTAE